MKSILRDVSTTTQPMIQTTAIPTCATTTTFPATNLTTTNVIEGATTQYTPVQHAGTVIHRPAIVQEQVHRKVVEEVQPILYREVYQPVVIEHIRPIHEAIQEPPRVYQDQTPMKDLGMRTISAPPQKVTTMITPPLATTQQYSTGWQQGTSWQQGTGWQQGRQLQQPVTPLPGNIVKVEYEVKGQEQQPFVERTVYKEVPLSLLQGESGMAYGSEWGTQPWMEPRYSQSMEQRHWHPGWGPEHKYSQPMMEPRYSQSMEQRYAQPMMEPRYSQSMEQRFVQPMEQRFAQPMEQRYSTGYPSPYWSQPARYPMSTTQQFQNLGQHTVGQGGFVRTPSYGSTSKTF